MSAVLREAIRDLPIEQIQQAIDVLQAKANLASDENSILFLTARNQMIHELERRASEEEGAHPAQPMCAMGITSHFAVRALSATFPGETADQMMSHSEDTIRTMWNKECVCPESQATEAWPQECPFDVTTENSPSLRPVSPLVIICFEGEEPELFITSAPPLNVWWAAEDRIANDAVGSWALVWRQHYGEMIHEGWVQSVSEGGEDVCKCLHYITRYRGGTPSPLPLSSTQSS